MALSIRDIIGKNLFDGVQLVAGFSGADNPITWVTVMEILDTPDSLQKGELLVTTGYRLSDESRHRTLMDTLRRRDISGIAIQTGYYIKEIPPYILRQAEQYGIPVMLLPQGLTFSAIIHTLVKHIEADMPETDNGLEQLRQKLCKMVTENKTLLCDVPDPAYTLVVMPARDDMFSSECVQNGAMRISSYITSQSQVVRQVSLPDGRMAFCMTLSQGNSISNVIFELTILLTFLSEQQRINFYVGVQQLTSANELNAAYEDALSCCDTLIRIGAKRGACYVQNLPFFELFNTINRNNRESVVGKQSILHTLLDYDRAHGTSYVHTLRVYLAQGGGQSATAARLFIHRHTLTNRLNKIQQLCGWDLNDYYTRTHLSVILMLHDYFAF